MGFAAQLEQSFSVLRVFDQFASPVTSSVRGYDLITVQDTDTGIGGEQGEVFARRSRRHGVVIEVESGVDAFLAAEGLGELGSESILGQR